MSEKKDPIILGKKIVELLGGPENILSVTNCMTRLRLTVKDLTIVKIEDIKHTKYISGLKIAGNEYQLILGPGFVDKVAASIKEDFPNISLEPKLNSKDDRETDLLKVTAENKMRQKEKVQSPITIFLSKFAKIFSPLIFAFIGAGILAGVAGMMQSFGTYVDPTNDEVLLWNSIALQSWFNYLNTTLSIWKDAFILIVGWRTAEVFGGRGATGALLSGFFVASFSGFYTLPFIVTDYGFNFLGIHITNPASNWLTMGFRPTQATDGSWALSYASGGIFGAMIIVGIAIPIEKRIAKVIPDSINLVATSTLVFLITSMFAYFLIIPLSGILFNWVNALFISLYSNPFGASFLAGIFLFAVVFGVHQGFVPIYASLLAETGVNALFPILAMAGAGQVGVGIALYTKTEQDSVLRQQIKGAIIPGFLGIGEPLIYGVTLPRPKTFAAAMCGGAVGGFFLGAVGGWFGLTVGLNTMFGPSGLLAAPMMTTPSGHVGIAIPIYLIALVISYASGFFFTYLIGTKNVDLS